MDVPVAPLIITPFWEAVMSATIYIATNQVTGHFYIGKTTKAIARRFDQHAYRALKRNSNTHFHRAIRKYGVEAFVVTLIESVDTTSVDAREKYWIETLNPHYNMTAGGEGGDTSNSPKYKAGMAQRRSMAGANNPMFGTKRSIPMTPERRENISKSRKGKPHPHRGHSASESTKQKLKEIALRQWDLKRLTDAKC